MIKSDRISAQGLNPEVVENFKKFVENKYGKLHTVYGLELEKAITMYLADQGRPQGRTHTHEEEQHRPRSSRSSKNVSKGKFEDMTQQFLATAGDCETFQRPYAERLIKETMKVYDARTIEKYCSELKNTWSLNR
jgi:hypothetical protein